jgi:hypothetical protein
MEKTVVRLAILFLTTTALSGCIWHDRWDGDYGRDHHGEYGEHHDGDHHGFYGDHHDGDHNEWRAP